MSLSNVSGGGGQLSVNYQNTDIETQETRRSDRSERTPAIARESFISSVVASRQPPRLALGDMLRPGQLTAHGNLFSADLGALALRDDQAISQDLASIFLEHADTVLEGENPQLAMAVETLGELLRDYEHLRILQTGELG